MPTITTEVYVPIFEPSDFYHKLNEEIPPTEFIGGWYPRKHLSILASRAGVGKTWYLLKLITDLSNGGTIFLQQAYYEKPKKCLFFCGECGITLMNERFNIMKEKPSQENIRIVSAIEAATRGINLSLDPPKNNEKISEGVTNIEFFINDFKPDIVIFDTMMSFRTDDENSSQNTRDTAVILNRIAEKFNVAVLATHHLRKVSKEQKKQAIDQDEIIGSSALVRMAGQAFIMSKNYKAIKITSVKSWWKEPPQLLYEMKEDNGIYFELADISNDITEARLRAERWILEQQKNHGQFTVKDVIKACNVSERTAQVAISNKAQIFMEMPSTGAGVPEKIYH